MSEQSEPSELTAVAAGIKRCKDEIDACMSYVGPNAYGALWGELDWRTERGLLEQLQAEIEERNDKSIRVERL